MNLLAIGDCLMWELRAFLIAGCRSTGIHLDMREMYFSARAGKGISTQDVTLFLQSNRMDVVALSFLTYEGLPLYPALLREAEDLSASEVDSRVTAIIKTMREFITDLREFTDAPFLLHNASGLPLTRWRKHLPLLAPLSRRKREVLGLLNRAIRDLADHTSKVVLVDEQAIASDRGYRNSARAVIPRDKEVDALNKQLHRELASYMVEKPNTITRCLSLMVISKRLERIADHAKNVAEEVVFLYEGRDIRHTGQATQNPNASAHSASSP
jgi:hypothetical protein